MGGSGNAWLLAFLKQAWPFSFFTQQKWRKLTLLSIIGEFWQSPRSLSVFLSDTCSSFCICHLLHKLLENVLCTFYVFKISSTLNVLCMSVCGYLHISDLSYRGWWAVWCGCWELTGFLCKSIWTLSIQQHWLAWDLSVDQVGLELADFLRTNS